MFVINEDLTIECTRGDAATFSIGANVADVPYIFREGDVVRFSVSAKKGCAEVVLRKDFTATAGSETVDIELTSEDTRIGGVINKPVDYWYEVELNPETHPQTIIGYDQDGAKVFRLYPESEV